MQTGTPRNTAPQDVEAERAILGAILLSGTVALPATIEEGVQPHDFYREQHGVIFATMRAMRDDGESIDFLTLTDRLRRDGMLDTVGGRAAIDLLAGAVPEVGNLRQYARIVVRKAMWRERRRLLLAALGQTERECEPEFRRALGWMRECELRFRPLLERDTPTP
jgi:replicative DNA helicase